MQSRILLRSNLRQLTCTFVSGAGMRSKVNYQESVKSVNKVGR